MDTLGENTARRCDRILTEKLRFLYQGIAAVPANLAVACVVAFLLRHTYPPAFLGAWLAANVLIAALRVVLHRRFLEAMARGHLAARWAPLIWLGALLSGLLWGALCLGLPFWGSPRDYVLLTLVGAGLTAGALTTIAAYLPAFLVYVCAFVLPLAIVSLASADEAIATTGWLIVLYGAVVCLGAKKLSASVTRTIELQVDNESLNNALRQALIDRDAARREKWSTLGQLSHELRTPLNAIMGFSETMREEVFGPLGSRRYREYANHIHGSGQLLLTLATEIIQLSQGETGTLQLKESVVDLSGIVEKCLDALSAAAKQADLALDAAVSPTVPLVRVDEAKIGQALLNLVGNAIKFTQAGGNIRIKVAQAEGGDIHLVVRDSGIGMTADEVQTALKPFGRIGSPLHYRTDGAGLGLPICKRMAELHGGSLRIDSRPGRGTVCTLTIPASRAVPGAERDASDAQPSERLACVA